MSGSVEDAIRSYRRRDRNTLAGGEYQHTAEIALSDGTRLNTSGSEYTVGVFRR
jgi:hypothetical protein